MSDKTILQHISELVEEENKLRESGTVAGQNHERIRELEKQLDQCWDLLRQRRALREFGNDPAGAAARPTKTVEGYEG
jgi:hypothetical protein